MPQYDHLSQEELVRLLQARDRRDATRFGLVWEANEIDRDKALNSDFVALDLDPELSTGQEPYRNLIIEADNFDALRYLRMTYAGRIKCILIDPPYNTGEKDFVYNDDYVDKNDSWKHSKWIEFLYQRLVIARDLLTEDGVLLVCINDANRAKLEMLLEKVMPNRFVGSFVWRTRSGANDSKEYFRSMDHEHVLCFANPDFAFSGKAKTSEAYSNPDQDKRGVWCNDNLVKSHNYKQRPNTFYPIRNPENDIWYACDPDNVWRFASEARLKDGQQLRTKTIEQIIQEKKILWPKDERTVCYDSKADLLAAIEAGTAPRNLRLGNSDEEKAFWDKELDFWVGKTIGYGKPRYKRHLSEVRRSEKPFSSWVMPSALKKAEREDLDLEGLDVAVTGGTLEGTSLVQEILGNKDFDYPKPLSLVQAFIKQSTCDEDIILDFFAGSGTTAHAVLAQNAEDDQDRRFIMISNAEATEQNPERNICRDVCAKRIQRVITGYNVPTRTGRKDVAGIGGDFAYLRCRRISPGRLLEIEHEQVWTALQMIHQDVLSPYAAGDFLIVKEEESALVYVPRFKKAFVPDLRKALKDCVSAVIYSWQPELLRQQIRASNVQHEAIPESLARRFGLKG